MLFTINDLGFSIAGLLLEGWLAFAARCVCALALLFIGWVVSRWMQKKLFPRLLKRSWHFAFTHPLLESFARPAARIAWYTGMYLALRSLPWAIPGLAALLLKAYRMMLVFLIGTGFYHASGIAALLLASSSEEVRTNRTLLTLLDKVYKVAVVVLCGATIAQESGLPVGSVVASAGLIGLTISLAAQDMAKNFFSGVVILLDKPFSIGDWITVGDVEGEVVDINFRSTKVRAVDNSIYILTNSTVSSATINNATLRNKRLYRFTLGVTYDTTRPQLEKLMADLDAMLKASPDTYEDTAFVRMTGFGDSSINLMVSAYLRTADYGVFLRMQNDLNLNIMDVMKADGVEFAFPSTTVYLEKEGYVVKIVNDGVSAINAFKQENPDLTLLDIMIPKLDGWQVCREIRKFSDKPIIMLTAKGETFDKVLGLELGADDYVTKPFDTKEVVARIKAVLRRTAPASDTSDVKEVNYDKLSINLTNYEMKVNGVSVDTPPKELELIYHLASNPNRVFTRDQLLDEVWGFDYYGDSRTVDVHVKRLREKLEGVSDKWTLKTVWGVGYKFELLQ